MGTLPVTRWRAPRAVAASRRAASYVVGMDLRMARGDEARAVPTELEAELAQVAQAADEAVNRDQPLARERGGRELDIHQAAEEASGQPVHKGHAPHGSTTS